MKPSEILDQDVASESSLFGKVIFLIATPGTGAEVLVRALGELPGVATMPTQTLLFSQGLHRVLEHWWEDRTAQGLHRLVNEQQFLLAARLLADEPLEAARNALGGDYVVEYSVDHILTLEDINAVYPDAVVVHVVRDGRLVAERLTEGLHPLPARFAARRWVDDQRAALDAEPDGTVRFETVMDEPVKSLGALAEALTIDADAPALEAAASHFRGARHLLRPSRPGRAGAIVEIVAPDLLLEFDYPLSGSPRSVRMAAWTEIAASGTVNAASNLRRRVQHAVSSRFGVEAWRPYSQPE